MSSTTTSGTEKSATAPAKRAKDSLRSYWYPDRDANMEEVNAGYYLMRRYLALAVVPVAGLCLGVWMAQRQQMRGLWTALVQELATQAQKSKDAPLMSFLPLLLFLCGACAVLVGVTVYWSKRRRRVLLVDFHVFTPPDSMKVTKEKFMTRSRAVGAFSEEALNFQEKLLNRTGLGEETYFPKGILAVPPVTDMQHAREEAEFVLGGSLEQLLKKTGLKPKDVDILIINCSLFNPTPSLCSMMINKFKMRSSILSYNLSGMGCSAGLISIDLAKDLLQVHKNCNAVVLSTENITQNWYKGEERSMLVSNTLFRVGGAAILLSNKRSDHRRAKYELVTTVRVHKGQSDEAYQAVFQCQDDKGVTGVRLSQKLLLAVGDALKSNMTKLGPIVLPWSEQIKFFVNLCWRKMRPKSVKPYVPDFAAAFEHFCIHAGGRAIIDGLQENLGLTDEQTEPSRATLYRYGNTSSASVWYELNFIERAGRMKRGDRVWQIAVGSGLKCNSAVWKSLKSFRASGKKSKEE